MNTRQGYVVNARASASRKSSRSPHWERLSSLVPPKRPPWSPFILSSWNTVKTFVSGEASLRRG
ncbi:MAG: hypothetical protein OEZ44_10255 [Candidatus Bathyarchaeota archaeon]|nr:hypothetical protein [Candidatus Bathyarchaeota archaeon]